MDLDSTLCVLAWLDRNEIKFHSPWPREQHNTNGKATKHEGENEIESFLYFCRHFNAMVVLTPPHD